MNEFTGNDDTRAHPDKILIQVDDDACTCAGFSRDTEILAGMLDKLGAGGGRKVGLILPNSTAWYRIFWAIVKSGSQPVPLDPQTGEWEMERLLSLLEVATCFITPVYRANTIGDHLACIRHKLPLLKNVIEVSSLERLITEAAQEPFVPAASLFGDTQPGTLMYACTSGTTGNPRVIEVPYCGFFKAQRDMADYLGFTPRDVMLLGMPLYHQGGFGMGLQMALAGGTVIYQPVFDPERFLRTVEKQKVTVIQLTATLAKIILSVPGFDAFNLSGVRMCYFAGELLPMELARVFFEKLGIRVINIIGSSETATMVAWDSEYDRAADCNTFRPLPFTRMKILDSGHREVEIGGTGSLFIHTDALITSYYRNEAETALRLHEWDGLRWFDTGDLGIRLAGGRVRFAGRAKRIIKRGSNLVYPEEIESFLLTHPDIVAVAVTGEKHELFGEAIAAHIEPRAGAKLGRVDIARFCRGKLAAFKIPDWVYIVDTIPHDIGKVQFKYLNR